MGLIDYLLSFFHFKSKDIKEPSDILSDDHFNAPFAKRFKPNHHQHSVTRLNIENMSPKQYFSSKRKVPTPRKPLPPPVEIQIPESDDDDDDCTIISTQQPSISKPNGNPRTSPPNDDEDEIQVLSSNEDQEVNIVHQESSPCSSRSQKMNHLSSTNKPPPEVYPIDEDDENQVSNKENHQGKKNKQNEDEDIQVLEDRPSKALVIGKKNQLPSNQLFPRWTVDRSAGRSLICPRSPGSSFLFKRNTHERNNTLQHIQKIRSREDYAKLIQAITSLNGNGTSSSINTSRDPTPLPSSSRNSSTPSGSELDILERLSSRGFAGSNPSTSRHVSINSGNRTKGFIDIGKALTKKTDMNSSNRFRFLDSGPQLSNSMAVVKTPNSKEDSLDAMIRKIQSIDLHRFDSQISRRALALEKTNEKVRSLEVPTYNVLLEKTINLRKVPERLQVKKVEPELPPITEELENLVSNLKTRRMNEVVSKVVNEEITKDQILSLQGLTWLKDNVINCYMALIMERSNAGQESNLPKVYGFNTFFHSTLENGYNRVKRWTKKIDLFSFDLILIPIHVQKVHWCLATIDFRKKCVTYYDSMGGPDMGVLKRLLNYLGEESMDKKKTPFDTSSWSLQCPKDVPQQQNSCDCGVFTSTFAEYLSRNADIFKVKQKDMPYYRKKMMVEILSKKLLT